MLDTTPHDDARRAHALARLVARAPLGVSHEAITLVQAASGVAVEDSEGQVMISHFLARATSSAQLSSLVPTPLPLAAGRTARVET